MSGHRWDLSDLRRAAAIAVAVTAVGIAWSTSSARDAVRMQPSQPDVVAQKQGPSTSDPGQNVQYWIIRINAPADGTEQARALWITPLELGTQTGNDHTSTSHGWAAGPIRLT